MREPRRTTRREGRSLAPASIFRERDVALIALSNIGDPRHKNPYGRAYSRLTTARCNRSSPYRGNIITAACALVDGALGVLRAVLEIFSAWRILTEGAMASPRRPRAWSDTASGPKCFPCPGRLGAIVARSKYASSARSLVTQPMIATRTKNDSDWPIIGALADASARQVSGGPPQQAWLRNRMAFGRRRRLVAGRRDRTVDYGAFKCPSGATVDCMRQFCVIEWGGSDSTDIADALTGEPMPIARSEQVSCAWMQEYADDDPLLECLLSRGSGVGQAYAHGDQELADLGRHDRRGADYRVERSSGRLDSADEAAT